MDDSDTSSCVDLAALAEYNGPSSPSPSEVMVMGVNTSQSTIEDTSIEDQTSTGSLHAHSQVVVQCLHQHTSVSDVLQHRRMQPGDIIKEYLNCRTHVLRQVYETNSE